MTDDFDDCQCEELFDLEYDSKVWAQIEAEDAERESAEEFWRFYLARACELETVD
jgi:hypothetical protein